MVGFGEAIKRAFAGWSTWSGRSTRAEYWWWALFVWLVSLIPNIGLSVTLGGDDGGSGGAIWWILSIIVALILILPSIAVSVRRLHDTDRSGWWYWIVLVPCIGPIWYFILMVLPSTPGQNRFG
jgi:uncharacterized membrane protein YhaH (DUF805 family)